MSNEGLPEIPWIRIFVEGAVIVGSILLAFGIDAWWEDVGARERDRGYLMSLRDEFGETLAHAQAQREIRDVAARSSASLIGQVQGKKRAETDSLYLWFSLTSMPIGFIPPISVFNDAAASGAIQRIRQDDLRIALVQYPLLLDRLREQDEAASAVSELRLQPFLEGRVPRVERLRRGFFGGRNEYEFPFGPSSNPVDFNAVFGEPELEDMLAERWFRLMMGSVNLADVEAHLVEVISLIDLELTGAE
jgi:hypothetical protein